jgi:hypothetical protein
VSTNPELLLPAIRDENGRELSQDETLSRWLLTGQVKPITPAPDYSEEPMRKLEVDPTIAFLGPGEAGEREYMREQFKSLINGLDEHDSWLVWRHVVQGKTFAAIAAEDEVSRQACHQRFERIRRRLNALADDLPEPDEAEVDAWLADLSEDEDDLALTDEMYQQEEFSER